MEFKTTFIRDLVIIQPQIFGDERGFFLESFKKSEFTKNGIADDFVQDNHSKSAYGVLRGLHYQLNPRAQGKLLRCVKGSIFDVAVDIRNGSPTFGKWFGIELSAINKTMFYIPPGFAHGFLTLEDNTEVLYKTTAEYSKEDDRGVLYNDKEVGIVWPIVNGTILLSEKDQKQPLLKDAEINFIY